MAAPQDVEPPKRFSPLRMLFAVGFMTVTLAALAWVATAASGPGVGANGVERVAYGVGAALARWGLGAVVLFLIRRGRQTRPMDYLLTAAVMVVTGGVTIGPRWLGRVMGEDDAAASSPGAMAYAGELERDYPDAN